MDINKNMNIPYFDLTIDFITNILHDSRKRIFLPKYKKVQVFH